MLRRTSQTSQCNWPSEWEFCAVSIVSRRFLSCHTFSPYGRDLLERNLLWNLREFCLPSRAAMMSSILTFGSAVRALRLSMNVIEISSFLSWERSAVDENGLRRVFRLLSIVRPIWRTEWSRPIVSRAILAVFCNRRRECDWSSESDSILLRTCSLESTLDPNSSDVDFSAVRWLSSGLSNRSVPQWSHRVDEESPGQWASPSDHEPRHFRTARSTKRWRGSQGSWSDYLFRRGHFDPIGNDVSFERFVHFRCLNLREKKV